MAESNRHSFSDSRLERELLYTDDSHKIRMRDSQIIEETRDTIISEYNEARRLKLETEASILSTAETVAAGTPVKEDKEEKEDVERLKNTIRDLDTGEVYVLGENDPSFKFDTIEISPEELANTTPIVGPVGGGGDGGEKTPSQQDQLEGAFEGTMESGNIETGSRNSKNKDGTDNSSYKGKKSWWKRLIEYLYGHSQSSNDNTGPNENTTNKPLKTPFTKLSSFKFKKELGRGAFGRVLLAESKTDGSLYALKIISKKNMRSSDKRQAKTERDILHAMGQSNPHPFTTGLKFAFQSENNLYLGMNYIPGGTLRELIKAQGSLPEAWVRIYSSELVLAISHMHSLQMLYRDIKPHNVMIDARGHITIIDFGLSKQEISSPRGAMSLVGTPDYSAPEVLKTGVHQIEEHKKKKKEKERAAKNGKKGMKYDKDNGGDKDGTTKERDKDNTTKESPHSTIGYGKAADWWSLGVMIYEMLSGTPAFRGTDLRHTYQRVLFADLEFTPPEKFSEPARELLQGLLNRDPTARLGAHGNPPQDIMTSAFFEGILWDTVGLKEDEGPWLPTILYKERKRKISITTSTTTTPTNKADDGEGETVVGREELKNSTSATPRSVVKPLTPLSNAITVPEGVGGVVGIRQGGNDDKSGLETQERHAYRVEDDSSHGNNYTAYGINANGYDDGMPPPSPMQRGVADRVDDAGKYDDYDNYAKQTSTPTVKTVVSTGIYDGAAPDLADDDMGQDFSNHPPQTTTTTTNTEDIKHTKEGGDTGTSDGIVTESIALDTNQENHHQDSESGSEASTLSSTRTNSDSSDDGIVVRDSVFVTKPAEGHSNRVQDWSFVDAGVLYSVSGHGPDGQQNKKKKKKKSKKQREKDSIDE